MVGELLRRLLHAQAEMGLQQVADFLLEAGGVLGAELRCFHGVPSSSDAEAHDERRLQRQLGRGEQECFAGQRFRDAVDFIEHLAGLDLGDVVLGVAFAVAHADLGGLLRNGLVRKDPDPDPAAALDVARDRAASRLDLARRQAAALGGLQAEVAERHVGATGGDAGVSALLFLAVLPACGLQHSYSPLPPSAGGGATALRTRLTAGALGASAGAACGAAGATPSAGLPASAWAGRGARSPPPAGPPAVRVRPPGAPPGPPGPPGRGPRRLRRSSSAPAGVLMFGASPLASRSPR